MTGALGGYGSPVRDAINVVTWDDGAVTGDRAVFVHGSTTWGTSAFARQRPLAHRYRLELMDRRGYGDSPDVAHSDATVDAQDLAALLAGHPAHLVGHSSGAVVALLAAAHDPGAVRSLTLIEPSCYRAVPNDPVLASARAQNLEALAAASRRPPVSPAEYLRRSAESLDLPAPEPTPPRLRAAETAMRERPAWDVEVPLEDIGTAPWPKLVICGTWASAPERYRRLGGEPSMACGRAVAQAIGAELVTVRCSAHEPHWEQAEVVNATLLKLWEQA